MCETNISLGSDDAVFILEDGATIRNVVIGANSLEGIHCKGACNIEFAWFEDVCEDAISILGSGTANIIGGGAYKASDKVIQHNGCGHVCDYIRTFDTHANHYIGEHC